MIFEELVKKMGLIPGDLLIGAKYLYDQSMATPDGVSVEIGVAGGGSSVPLTAAAHEKNSKHYCIDPYDAADLIDHEYNQYHGNSQQIGTFLANMTKLDLWDNWRLITYFSFEVARRFNLPISLLFIDGCHCFECVKKDYELWVPKIIKGGIVVFHDASWPGVSAAIQEFEKSEEFKKFSLIDTTFLKSYRKMED